MLTEGFRQRQCLSVFLSRRKKNSEKERPLRGFRREVSPDLLRRTEMKSKAGAQCGSAPRDPPRNEQAGSDSRRRQRTQRKKFLYSRRKVLVCKPRGTIPTLPSPLRAAKQGLGSELTSGGGQEPSLTEPQRDRCRRSRRMRCRFRLRNRLQTKKLLYAS